MPSSLNAKHPNHRRNMRCIQSGIGIGSTSSLPYLYLQEQPSRTIHAVFLVTVSASWSLPTRSSHLTFRTRWRRSSSRMSAWDLRRNIQDRSRSSETTSSQASGSTVRSRSSCSGLSTRVGSHGKFRDVSSRARPMSAARSTGSICSNSAASSADFFRKRSRRLSRRLDFRASFRLAASASSACCTCSPHLAASCEAARWPSTSPPFCLHVRVGPQVSWWPPQAALPCQA
mmetsp:Transcript_55925/g.156881  ORF Transcript_55925/g.156881 Transcript_55925/m.156881 type:complete len:230 (+) Transcript_55925:370-1059(+)